MNDTIHLRRLSLVVTFLIAGVGGPKAAQTRLIRIQNTLNSGLAQMIRIYPAAKAACPHLMQNIHVMAARNVWPSERTLELTPSTSALGVCPFGC